MKRFMLLLGVLIPMESALAISCAKLCKMGDYSACMMMAGEGRMNCSDLMQERRKELSSSLPESTKWNLESAKKVVMRELKKHGSAKSYGYGALVRQYGNIPMKHQIVTAIPFRQKGREAYVLVTNSNPSGYNDYRAAASKLSFFVFEKVNGTWKLAYKHIAAQEYAHFGQAPSRKDVRLVKMGQDTYAIEMKNYMATQGWGAGDVVWYRLSPSGIEPVWKAQVSEDNSGTLQNDTDWKLTYKVITKRGEPYGEIVAHKRGKIDGKSVNTRVVYQFDGMSYQKVKQANTKKRVHAKSSVCKWFSVEGVKQLNVRNAPGKKGKVVGRLSRNEKVCIYRFEDKWGLSDAGWISGKYLRLNIYDIRNNFLESDIDGDGKYERLVWKRFGGHVGGEAYFQLILLDDNKKMIWKGPKVADWVPLVAYTGMGAVIPVYLGDIDRDGRAELVMESVPTELDYFTYDVYEWNGSRFVSEFQGKPQILKWKGSPKGKTLKWQKAPKYGSQGVGKVAFVSHMVQLQGGLTPLVSMMYVDMKRVKYLGGMLMELEFVPGGAVVKHRFK